MTKFIYNLPCWLQTAKWASIPLASTIILSSCGGGYDGGAKFTATPPPIETPPATAEPTAIPVPDPITKSETPREKEWLDRGLVAVPTSKGNIVSWRLLGTDDPAINFDVYKNDAKLNDSPIDTVTFYRDIEGTANDSYHVVAVLNESEVDTSASVTPWASSYLNIPLNKPSNGITPVGEEYSYYANDASTADLDGDGQLDIILKWMPSNSKDNAQQGYTGKAYIDAYTLQGKQLWRIDLGPNIRAGAHYNPFIVYDFDGDGRAELAVKTADGTIDGQGTVIGDAETDYRQTNGYILEGPEFLTMFDGLSGEALDTIDYKPARGNVDDWGDDYGNRVDRFLAGVAYLNGEKPSLLMSRGYYTRAVIAAYDWVDGAFQEKWTFDSDLEGPEVAGQGNHQLSIADVDGDRNDEIIFGAATINHDGNMLYSTNLCHGDALHVGDLDPNRDGLEVYTVHEEPNCYSGTNTDGNDFDFGSEMHDAATGEILWGASGSGDDVGRGVSIDVDPRYPGNESWSTRNGMFAADGTQIIGGTLDPENPHEEPGPINFAVWWDGDLLREMLDGTVISKWEYANQDEVSLLDASKFNAVSINGSKANPSLAADILGDWREEVIWPSADNNTLMVFSNTDDTGYRFLTLMHDSQYRAAIAWQNVGYNQPAHPSFYIGPNTAPVWQSDIATTEGKEWGKLVARGQADSIEVQVYTNNFEVSSIKIMRSVNPDDTAPETVFTMEGTQRVWIDDTVEEDQTYYYWAELVDSTATSEIALNKSKAQIDDGLVPLLAASASEANKTPFQLQVAWTAINIEAASVEVFRGTIVDGSDRVSIATLEGTATTYLDTSPDPFIDNYYWVVITDTDEETYESNATLPLTLGPLTNITTELVGATDANNNRVSAIKVSWDLDNFPYPFASIELYRNDKNQLSGRTRVEPSAAESGEFIDFFDAGGPAIDGQDYWYMFKIQMDTGEVDENNNPILQRFDSDPSGQITYSATIPPSTGIATELVYVDDGNGGQTSAIKVTWDLKDFPLPFASIELYRNDKNELSGRTRVNPAAEASGEFIDLFTEGGPGVDGQDYWYMFKIQMDKGDGTLERFDSDPAGKITYQENIDPNTNLATELVENGIQISWDFENFPLPFASIELYRNTSNELNGRTRLLASAEASGTITDDGTLGNTAGDAPLVEGQEYWYMFKIQMDNGDGTLQRFDSAPEAQIVYQAEAPAAPSAEPSGDPATNLTTQVQGNSIVVSWNLENFPLPFSSIELYRNTSNELNGRTRLLASAEANGTITDDGTLGNNAGDAPLVSGQEYWYMFKIQMDKGDGTLERFDSEPEAQVTAP